MGQHYKTNRSLVGFFISPTYLSASWIIHWQETSCIRLTVSAMTTKGPAATFIRRPQNEQCSRPEIEQSPRGNWVPISRISMKFSGSELINIGWANECSRSNMLNFTRIGCILKTYRFKARHVHISAGRKPGRPKKPVSAGRKPGRPKKAWSPEETPVIQRNPLTPTNCNW